MVKPKMQRKNRRKKIEIEFVSNIRDPIVELKRLPANIEQSYNNVSNKTLNMFIRSMKDVAFKVSNSSVMYFVLGNYPGLFNLA